MKITDAIIKDLKIIEPEVFHDFRGEYIETFNEKEFKKVNGDIHFVQDDISVSRRGTLRGLHGDDKTWKLIQCLKGSIYVAVIDMREDSPTYLQHQTFTISDKNRKQILVPIGCANGHLCMSDECIFSYKQTTYYEGQGAQFTIKWDDKRFNIYWPIKNPILSIRDSFYDKN